jgi:hypothetical protein
MAGVLLQEAVLEAVLGQRSGGHGLRQLAGSGMDDTNGHTQCITHFLPLAPGPANAPTSHQIGPSGNLTCGWRIKHPC